ncbi:hypothetical protein, partial [Staphylococcus simulans]|uniref:hypothetical protein n=1 Tax=Staphylococcus simulans TaxID=1286 RepID=UPI000EDA3A08
YHYFTPRNNNGINRNHQLAVSEKLKNKKKYSFIKLPGFITISQYILIVIPSLIPSYFTSKQLIIYIVIVILIVIITLQIHNSILINLDWYSNFICYLSNSNRNPKILLNILHRNNLKIIFIIGFSIFLESLYIYNQLYWWIFPLLFLIWKIDCSFTYYSFKVLSVSQRENLRQHTNKQLPYVCLIGIAVFLMTTINKIETKIDFSRFGIFVVCLALISLVYILEKEGEVSFIERMERNFNDSYKNQKPKL